MTCLILASQSPQRSALLQQINVEHQIIPATIDETPRKREKPTDLVCRLAQEKALSVATMHPDCFVLGADTVVTLGGRVFGKPLSAEQALSTLQILSGKRHRVLGGVCLVHPATTNESSKKSVRTVISRVAFKRLTEDEINAHAESMEWRGRAGGYAIQGRAAAFVRFMSGSYSNIVGLPLFETAQLLKGNGLLSP